MSARRLTRLGLGFGISALLLVLLFRSVDVAALGRALAVADFRLLPPAIALYFVGVWLRSRRWGLLLPRDSVPAGALFRALVVGFTVNNVLPARLGEVARAYLLARWCGVRYGHTLASVVMERVLDGLTLAGLLLVAVTVAPAPPYLLSLGLVVGAVFAAGAVILVGASWQPRLIVVIAGLVARLLPARLGEKVVRLAEGFGAGLALVRGWGLLGRLVVLSLLAWLAEIGLFYLLMLAFPIPASPALAALTGTVANFATLVPSSPGYVGTFDGALVKVLQDSTRLPLEVATAYALLVHAALLIPVTLLGAVFLWRAGVSMGEITGPGSPLAEAGRPSTLTGAGTAGAPSGSR